MSKVPLTQPSDLYAPFTWERLSILAKLLWDARQWVAENAVPERGDRACGIGLRCWEHGTYAVAKAAAERYADWLSIADQGAHFVFKIASMPIRFYRGESDESVPENYTADDRERGEIELALGKVFTGYFRIVVEADSKGFPQSVHLAHAAETGRIIMSWRIPVRESGSGDGAVPIVTPKLPVELPALVVRSIAEVEAEKAAQAAAEEAARQQQNQSSGKGKGA